jgi:hypothetical protein
MKCQCGQVMRRERLDANYVDYICDDCETVERVREPLPCCDERTTAACALPGLGAAIPRGGL